MLYLPCWVRPVLRVQNYCSYGVGGRGLDYLVIFTLDKFPLTRIERFWAKADQVHCSERVFSDNAFSTVGPDSASQLYSLGAFQVARGPSQVHIFSPSVDGSLCLALTATSTPNLHYFTACRIISIMTAKKHSDRLRKMAQRTPQQVAKALYAAGQLIEADAEQSITAGSISGAGHIPSLPGQPPNADTRFLDTNVETEIGGPGVVTVTSKAPYSAALEYGTSRMAARPFMRPAVERNRKKVAQMVGEALNVTIK